MPMKQSCRKAINQKHESLNTFWYNNIKNRNRPRMLYRIYAFHILAGPSHRVWITVWCPITNTSLLITMSYLTEDLWNHMTSQILVNVDWCNNMLYSIHTVLYAFLNSSHFHYKNLPDKLLPVCLTYGHNLPLVLLFIHSSTYWKSCTADLFGSNVIFFTLYRLLIEFPYSYS